MKGTYRHYKGNNYEVLGEAVYTSPDTKEVESFILYRSLYGFFDFWIRPKEIFFGTVDLDGNTVQRFVKISESQKDAMKNINMNKVILIHTETEDTYKVVGIDAYTGSYILGLYAKNIV